MGILWSDGLIFVKRGCIIFRGGFFPVRGFSPRDGGDICMAGWLFPAGVGAFARRRKGAFSGVRGVFRRRGVGEKPP